MSPTESAARPTLVFDLGGVLLENATFARLAALGTGSGPELESRWLASPAVRTFERGESSPGAFAAAFVREWALSVSPEEFLAEFATWPSGLYPGASHLLARLRPRHRLACLSNSNAVHWHRFRGFLDAFDIALSSHLLGAVKPDAECFRRALDVLQVAPGDIVYFDDARENVDAASRLGLRAHQVVGFDALVEAVDMLGLG